MWWGEATGNRQQATVSTLLNQNVPKNKSIVGAGLGTIVGAGLGTIVGAGLGTIVGAGLGTIVGAGLG
ncbi:MAG: hypothetical protein RLO37_17940, partial [Coleofasciculus chthonoplastes F1-TOW-03]